MLVAMETKDGLRKGAIMVITKKLAWHMETYSTLNNIILLLSTPMVLIYNCELGIINSSEFFHSKKLWKKGYVLPNISILTFSEVWWGVTT